jgi:hypothetical protein
VGKVLEVLAGDRRERREGLAIGCANGGGELLDHAGRKWATLSGEQRVGLHIYIATQRTERQGGQIRVAWARRTVTRSGRGQDPARASAERDTPRARAFRRLGLCAVSGNARPRGARVGAGPYVEGRGDRVAGRAGARPHAKSRRGATRPSFCSTYLHLTANISKILNNSALQCK